MIDFILTVIKDALVGAHSNYKDRLSDDERQVLKECAGSGELLLMKADICGSWLRAGKRDFIVETDPAVQATFLEAFERLCRRGYVRHEGGMLFRLTGTGFKVARELGGARQAVIEG